MFLWDYTWDLLCAWTPKPLNPWRLLVLRWWGARGAWAAIRASTRENPDSLETHPARPRLSRRPRQRVQPRARSRSARGPRSRRKFNLCAGTHDFTNPALPLQTAPIHVGEDAFIGVRAVVLPGVTVGAGSVIGAGSIVTRDVPPGVIAAGNPLPGCCVRADPRDRP